MPGAAQPFSTQQPFSPTANAQKLVCSVGVTAYNEENNIGHLLEALIEQHLHRVEIAEIIVVASACTDRTVPIIQQYMARDARIKLIEQPRREGKTSAINLFLAAVQTEICVSTPLTSSSANHAPPAMPATA